MTNKTDTKKTKRESWTYKKMETPLKIYGKLSPKLMLVDTNTGTTWFYSDTALDERLDKNPNLNECHLKWKGSWHRQGYAMFNVIRSGDDNAKSGLMNVQRLLKAIQLDRPLKAEERVYSTCNNSFCTNLLHLQIGDRSACILSKPRKKNLVKSRYPTEWLLANKELIQDTKAKALSTQLDLTLNQAQYLKHLLRQLVKTKGAVTTIDLRKLKSAQ
jgi:hypothetical protein